MTKVWFFNRFSARDPLNGMSGIFYETDTQQQQQQKKQQLKLRLQWQQKSVHVNGKISSRTQHSMRISKGDTWVCSHYTGDNRAIELQTRTAEIENKNFFTEVEWEWMNLKESDMMFRNVKVATKFFFYVIVSFRSSQKMKHTHEFFAFFLLFFCSKIE